MAVFGSGTTPQVQLWLHPIAESAHGFRTGRREASELARRLLGVALTANRISLPAGKLACPALELFDAVRERSGIEVSLAHCRGLILAGLAPGPVGIDCERADRARDWAEMADLYFSTGEATFIRSLSKEEAETAFLRYWTLKESMVKAIRGSVLTDLNRLIVESWEAPPRVRTKVEGTWYAWQGQYAACSAAMVCALPGPPDLRLFGCPDPRKPDQFARFSSDELLGEVGVFKVR